MKAVVAERYGGPEVLAIIERPLPEVGANDVRIAVKAASLNPLDFKIRDGKLKLVNHLKPPVALGCDVAGVIEAIGTSVTGFSVGDEVFARLEKNRMGGLAESVSADASVVAKKPARATFEQAASIPLAALTALQALRESAKLVAGQRVLIHAGAGGVGSLAIQIAKILGLHVTTTTSTKNIEFVRELGADAVVDYTKSEPLPTELDAVFDTLGETELASIAATKRGGTVVGIGGLPDGEFARERLPVFARPAIWLMTGRRRRAAARAGVRFTYLFMRPDGKELGELAAWIEAGTLKPIVHATYPLAQVREAFAELERGRARGKIVITI
ncbi:MAG: NADP-dependent oxidoreductase [Kofleriaceae bacterium]